MIKKLWAFIKARPPGVVLWKIETTVFRKKIPHVREWLSFTQSKECVEIGGPSGVFRHYLPVYSNLKSLDAVNFSDNPIWEDFTSGDSLLSSISEKKIIAEGTDLNCIANESYEVLLSCNNLEHIANPLKALFEWKRVLKSSGVIICILPRKESNFDHKRTVTTLEHLIQDYENNTGEDDMTHLPEILKLHDLSRDPLAGTFEQFKKRSENNFEYRALHHHVFDTGLLKSLMSYTGMQTVITYSSPMDHFILAVKEKS